MKIATAASTTSLVVKKFRDEFVAGGFSRPIYGDFEYAAATFGAAAGGFGPDPLAPGISAVYGDDAVFGATDSAVSKSRLRLGTSDSGTG